MEISTAPGSWSDREDKEDTAAAAPSVHIPHPSNADENEVEEAAQNQAKETKTADKGKGRDQKKHGVMSLPAEIRERYALQSSASVRTLYFLSLSSRLLT